MAFADVVIIVAAVLAGIGLNAYGWSAISRKLDALAVVSATIAERVAADQHNDG